MKHAISNIALPPKEHSDGLRFVAGLGFTGLEVAPSRIWEDSWHGVTAAGIASYRRQVEAAGLRVVGLHSLLFDQPGLSLFGGAEGRRAMLDFFVHLSQLCRDLGGRTLIWGGGRKRGPVSDDEAREITVDFFAELADRTAANGTVFCLEPLAHADTDFLHSVLETRDIARAVGRPELRVQIDVKALAANGELRSEIFGEVAGDLVHVHANEPGFGILGSSDTVDHDAAGALLREIGYDGYVSIEQRMIDANDIETPIRQSMAVLQRAYR